MRICLYSAPAMYIHMYEGAWPKSSSVHMAELREAQHTNTLSLDESKACTHIDFHMQAYSKIVSSAKVPLLSSFKYGRTYLEAVGEQREKKCCLQSSRMHMCCSCLPSLDKSSLPERDQCFRCSEVVEKNTHLAAVRSVISTCTKRMYVLEYNGCRLCNLIA